MCEINLKINPKVVNANRLESVTNVLVTGWINFIVKRLTPKVEKTIKNIFTPFLCLQALNYDRKTILLCSDYLCCLQLSSA